MAFVGVILEHFDMMLVNLYATSMITHFLHVEGQQQALIMGLLGYGISFLFRPLGAALFGLMGDLMGRRPAMLLSLLCMSLATLSLGLIPGVSQIGGWAFTLFALCRIVQGLSIGGEYGAALTFAYESSPDKKTTAGALVISATHVGGLGAALLAAHYPQNFQLVFIVAGVLGLVSLLFRSFLLESASAPTAKYDFKQIVATNWDSKKIYLRAFIIASALVFTFYASLIYLNEVIFQQGLATRQQIFSSNACLLVAWIIFPPLIAWGVDRFGISYRKIMQIGALGVGLLVLPLLSMANTLKTFPGMLGAQWGLTLFHIVYCFGTPRFLGDQFRTEVRSTGISLSYSLGASFTAALTPLICFYIVSWTGHLEAMAIPIILLSGLAAIQLQDKK